MIVTEDEPAPSLSRANSVSERFDQPRQESFSRQGSNISIGSGSNSEKHGGLTIQLPSLFKRKPKEKDILAMYDSGNLRELMDDLQISQKERSVWLKLWLDIDTRFENNVSYQMFIDYFLFEDNDFTRKVFEIMNSDLSAVLTLREFIEFCKNYLVIDKDSLQEFSFRLLLRQSSRYSQHSVADAVDLKYFIVSRYAATDGKETQKLSISLLKEMDDNEGQGLTCSQYKKFCKTCHSVEIFGTKFLAHMRNFVFGNDFWVQRSRLLKKVKLTGFAALTPMKRVNIDSEIYMNSLGLPVVDSKGRGLRVTISKGHPEVGSVGSGSISALIRDDSMTSSASDLSRLIRGSSKDSEVSSRILLKQSSGISSVGSISRAPSGIYRALSKTSMAESVVSDRGKSVLSRAGSSRSVVSSLSITSAKEIAVSNRLWLVPFDHEGQVVRLHAYFLLLLNTHVISPSQMRTTFEEDFPIIFEKRCSRKLKKKKEKDDLNRAAELMSSRTYQIMISAMYDLVSSKKGLLLAFRQWKDAVGLQSLEEAKEGMKADHDEFNIRDTEKSEENSVYSR